MITIQAHRLTMSRVAYQERLQVVKDFVTQHIANKHLSKRIDHHYNLLWKQSR